MEDSIDKAVGCISNDEAGAGKSMVTKRWREAAVVRSWGRFVVVFWFGVLLWPRSTLILQHCRLISTLPPSPHLSFLFCFLCASTGSS